MLGAIAGDMAGSCYEFRARIEDKNSFPFFSPYSRFTDDTVMTVALAMALIKSECDEKKLKDCIIDSFHQYGAWYPGAGYGGMFKRWLMGKSREPYNSYGNGSAMRVSPVGWAFNNLADVEKMAAISAEVTHNHPEGIKGAQAAAACIFLARTGSSHEEICDYISTRYGYNLDRSLASIKLNQKFDISCQKTVPESIIAFMESEDYEDAVRNAIWLEGDTDTQAAISGAIAEAFYGGVPDDIRVKTLQLLDRRLQDNFFEWEYWLESRR